MIKLGKIERALVSKVRKAVKYEDQGIPAKDAIDDWEMVEAMRLLLKLLNPEPIKEGENNE